jgi:hypothetical protein
MEKGMMKRHILCLIVILLCVVSRFAQSRRKGQISGSRAGVVSNIRQVDFKNFTYQIGGKRIRLRNGESSGRENWRFDRNFQTRRDYIAYGDLTGDGNEEAALVLATQITGAAGTVAQYGDIYTIKNGQVIKLVDFTGTDLGCSVDGWDCHLINVKIERGNLIVDRAEPTSDDSRCCPSMYRSTSYRWDGTRLIEIGKTSLKRISTN